MKVLYIVRGLPGSGKSTFANNIWNSNAICEADKFFINHETGEYNFDLSRLKEAHKWCVGEVRSKMQLNFSSEGTYCNEIVVSNTSTQEWEMQPYIDLANEFEYNIVSLIVENRHGNKSIHGVPDETLEKMRNRFEIKL